MSTSLTGPTRALPLSERIRNAAMRAYLDGGPAALTMRAVADEVGVTAPALYRHYRNKEELIEALAERGFEVFEERLRQASNGPTGIAALRASIDAYLGFALDHPELYELMFLARRGQSRRFPEDFAAGRSASFEMLRQRVKNCMNSGALRDGDPLAASLTIWSLTHGLVVLYVAGRFEGGRDRFRDLVQSSLGQLLVGLSPGQAARS